MRSIILFVIVCFTLTNCEQTQYLKDERPPQNSDFNHLKSLVDNHFFDYNYLTTSNLVIEELKEKNNIKSNKSLTTFGEDELYSQAVRTIRNHLRTKMDNVRSIKEKFGFPIWEDIREYSLGESSLVVIPFAKHNSTNIEAIMFVHYSRESATLKYKMISRKNIYAIDAKTPLINGKKYVDRAFVIAQFLYFDKKVFANSDCDLVEQFNQSIGESKGTLKAQLLCEYTITITEYTLAYGYINDGGETIIMGEYYSVIYYDFDYWCVEFEEEFPSGGSGENVFQDPPEVIIGYIPCYGDPVPNPIIAATVASMEGGTFGWTRIDANGDPKYHNGIDIAGQPGDPVYAMYDGIITVADNVDDSSNGIYIRMTILLAGEELQITMIHLSSIVVSVNQQVVAGQLIGYVGISGNACVPNPHVHISMKERLNESTWSDEYIDPAPYLGTSFDPYNNFAPIPCDQLPERTIL